VNLMNIAPALEVIETATVWGAKIYAVASEVFTISALLWTLNFLAASIEKVYSAGYHFGRFYRGFLHQYVVKLIAAIIFVCILAYEGAVIVYNNRSKIVPTLNDFRELIGKQFVYA